MKLAEALLEKKALSGRISDLQSRFVEAALITEGDAPEEDASVLMSALVEALARHEELTVQINHTNNTIIVGDTGLTMMQSLARRDGIKLQQTNYSTIAQLLRMRNRNRNLYGEATTTKVTVADGVNPSYYIKLVDTLGKEYRVLDTAIQAANWANDLVA